MADGGHHEERERIAQVLADVMTPAMEADVEGRVILTAYVLVAEWMDDKGEPWITRIDGPPNAQTNWKRDGMLHEALYGNWDPRDP